MSEPPEGKHSGNEIMESIIHQSLPFTKKNKYSGPGIICSVDGKMIINLEDICPPVPLYDASRGMHQEFLVYAVETVEGDGAPDDRLVFHTEDEDRKDFFIDIMTILSIQIVVTFSIVFACFYIDELRKIISASELATLLVLSTEFYLFVALLCSKKARQNVPLNFIILGSFTLCTSYLISITHAKFSTTKLLLISLSVTVLIAMLISLLSCMPCCDITGRYLLVDTLLISGVVLFILGFVYYWATGGTIVLYAFVCLFLLLTSVSLLHQFQLLLGKGKYAIHTDEYILASVTLYIPLVILFTALPIMMAGPPRK
ncbi:unnamed protein product [Phyllotreta striolata]|uniref:Uncharacterized protein n=1 Tax=Phyllotreta striolata TaxID=444603 RepID=A0A9N9XPN1_PHYSR|nr:unnamed protein product [Phyllotreta striolata]